MPGFRLWVDPEKQSLGVVRLKLESSGSAGSSKVPFQVADKDAYKAMIRGKGIFKRAEMAPIEDVDLGKIKAIQRTVNDERVSQHFEGRLYPEGTRAPGHGGLIDYPVIVKNGDDYFCHDGHHRCTAAKLHGDKSIRARVVDITSG